MASSRRIPLALGLSCAATLAVVGLSPLPGPGVAPAPARATAAVPLYPDLKTLPPRDLRFATVDVSSDPAVSHPSRVLQFSNTTYNAGEGPLDLRATINQSLSPPSGPAVQRVHDSAGGYVDYPVGSMYYHAVHQHYHYEGWGAYELWTKAAYDAWNASGRTTAGHPLLGSKTTSCVIDEEFIAHLPNTPYPAVNGSGGCQLDSTGTLHEGLSPGWGDTYDWYRYEQWIDLGSPSATLADGTYVLRSVADPGNLLYESPGRADPSREGAGSNEAATTMTVSGGQILDTQPPTGSISLNGVAATTPQPTVQVAAVGRDDVSGVDAFRLSNDGTHWGGQLAYTTSGSIPTTTSWSLTDPSTGGTPASGQKTVYAQFHDPAGHWGPATTATIGLAVPAASSYAGVVLTDGPVGYWRLGEASGTSAADATGAHPGTYAPGVVLGRPGLVPGSSDTSVGVAAGAGAVRVPNDPALTPASFSVEAWFRADTLPTAGSWASVVTKTESYSLQFNGPVLEFTLVDANGVRSRLPAPAGSVVTGKTYDAAATWDGTTQRLYLNGTLVASRTSSSGPRTTTSALQLGSWDGVDEVLAGTLDDVSIYPTALTATQVAHHTSSTGTTPSPSASPSASPSTSPSPSPTATTPPGYAGVVLTDGPVGYWRLGEASGTSAADATGAHPGTYAPGVVLGRPGLVPGSSDTSVGVAAGAGAVRVPNDPALTPASFSVEAWFRADTLPTAGSWASVVTKTESYSLQFNGPVLEFTLVDANGVRSRLPAPAGSVVTGKTYDAAATWDGTTQRLYLNGTLVASRTSSSGPRTTTSALQLGSWDGVDEVLAGTLDDVSIYPTALTATQVAHHTSSTGTTSGYPVTVSVGGAGHGTVTSQPNGISCPGTCSASFPADAAVVLTASPAGGSVFSGWSGGCSDTAPTCTVSTYAATTVRASFTVSGTPQTVTVTKGGSGAGSVTSSPAGISCGATCQTSAGAGSSITLTAQPQNGASFTGWAGACSGAALTCTFTVVRDSAVSATFGA